jgi:hypothetical protein
MCYSNTLLWVLCRILEGRLMLTFLNFVVPNNRLTLAIFSGFFSDYIRVLFVYRMHVKVSFAVWIEREFYQVNVCHSAVRILSLIFQYSMLFNQVV